MFSQHGVINLVHSKGQLGSFRRRVNAMRLNGIDAELLNREEVAAFVPELDVSATARFPVEGGLLQRRGSTARNDAVAWGYARAADQRGVDIIQNCEVTGIRRDQDGVIGVEPPRGYIASRRIGLAVAGHSTQLAAMAGVRLPIEFHVLQAMVSEPVKPCLDTVVTLWRSASLCQPVGQGRIGHGR